MFERASTAPQHTARRCAVWVWLSICVVLRNVYYTARQNVHGKQDHKNKRVKTKIGEALTIRARGLDTVHQRLSAFATTTLRARTHTASNNSYYLVPSNARFHRSQNLVCAQHTTLWFGYFEETKKKTKCRTDSE